MVQVTDPAPTKMALAKIKSAVLFPRSNRFVDFLRDEIHDRESVLDVGCGESSPLQHLGGTRYSVGVDVYPPAVFESRRKGIHTEYVCMDLRNLSLPSRSFDVVVALDIIEHFDRPDSLIFMERIESIARRKTIVFTPNGFVNTDTPEILGRHGNNPWRIHQCGWTVEELKARGYKCRGINGLKHLMDGDCQIRFHPKRLWGLISRYTQLFAWHYPVQLH